MASFVLFLQSRLFCCAIISFHLEKSEAGWKKRINLITNKFKSISPGMKLGQPSRCCTWFGDYPKRIFSVLSSDWARYFDLENKISPFNRNTFCLKNNNQTYRKSSLRLMCIECRFLFPNKAEPYPACTFNAVIAFLSVFLLKAETLLYCIKFSSCTHITWCL